MPLEHRFHPLGEELVHLLRRPADVPLRAELFLELLAGHAEGRVGGDPVQQVVLETLPLHARARGHGVLPHPLVQLLSVAAALHAPHHHVLGRHERQLVHQPRWIISG
jgi:hypothetical protein